MKRPKPPDAHKLDAEVALLFTPDACERIKQQRQAQQLNAESPTAIFKINRDAYDLWREVTGLWAIGAMGGIFGIAWERAEAVLRLQQYAVTPEAMRGCRIIESAFVEAYN